MNLPFDPLSERASSRVSSASLLPRALIGLAERVGLLLAGCGNPGGVCHVFPKNSARAQKICRPSMRGYCSLPLAVSIELAQSLVWRQH